MAIHNIYYITVRTRDGKQTTLKQVSISAQNAVITAMRRFKPEAEIASMSVSVGIPKTQANREKELRARERKKERKRQKERDKYVWYDGQTKIDKD